MDLQDVKEKMKRKNKILFSRESACLQELLASIRLQKHTTLVKWALECAKAPLHLLKERYPDETRPETALQLSEAWAKGFIKMPIAKKAILQAHAVAKGLTNPVDIALCHAVGQACATVHVETHAIGLPVYELTAIVLEYGIEECETILENKCKYYLDSLQRWAEKIDAEPLEWAPFLLDSTRPNKEQLLYEKSQGFVL